MTLRPDEDYIDTFERGWSLAMGGVAFAAPWLVIFTYDGNDSRFALGEWLVLLLWALAATAGVACVIAGRQVRRVGRIDTAIAVGDVLGALLFFISLVVRMGLAGVLGGGGD